MEVENNMSPNILWEIKQMKKKIVDISRDAIYDKQYVNLVQYFIDVGILQSLCLSRISSQIILEEYILLCKKETPQRIEQYTKNLFKRDILIQQSLKTLLKKRIKEKMLKSLNQSIQNIKFLLKYQAEMQSYEFQQSIQQQGGKDKSLHYFFQEFIESQFKKFIENLLQPLNEDSIIFDDAQKQDEYVFIIENPEEYIINKFIEYQNNKISIKQKDQQEYISLLNVLLEDNNLSYYNKEDALQMIFDLENKQNQSITQNENISKLRMLSDSQQPLNKQNPFLQQNKSQKQKFI